MLMLSVKQGFAQREAAMDTVFQKPTVTCCLMPHAVTS